MTGTTLPDNLFVSDAIYRRTSTGDTVAWGYVVDRQGKRWCSMIGSKHLGPDETIQSPWMHCATQEEALAAANGMRLYLMREQGYVALLSELPGELSPVPVA